VSFHTVEDGPWPYGVTVSVWSTSMLDGTGYPVGPPVDVAVASVDGTVTFGGLVEGGEYTAFGSGGSQTFEAVNIETRLGELGSVASLNVADTLMGATGNGTTDDTASILSRAVTALAEGKELVFPGNKTYVIENLAPPSGSKWRVMPGVVFKLKPGSTAQAFLIGDSTHDITIEGGELDCSSSGVGAIGMQLGGTRHTVSAMRIHDVQGYAIYVRPSSSWVTVGPRCHVDTHGLHGITVGGDIGTEARHVKVLFNEVENGTNDDASAFGIVGVGRHVSFIGNHTKNSGHDGIAAYNPANRDISAIGNSIEDPQNTGHGIHVAGQHLVVADNVFQKVNGYAIFLSASPNPPSDPTACTDATVEGNTVDQTEVAAAGAGIYAINYSDLTIGPNHIKGANGHGMHLEGCVGVEITGGSYLNSVLGSGLRINGSSKVTILGGRYSGNLNDGITILDKGAVLSTDITINKPEICSNGGKGINLQGNAAGNRYEIIPGTMRGNVGGNISALSTTSKVGIGMVDDSDTIASASSITPPYGHDVFFVTGTTQIDNIGSGARAKHRRISLIFQTAGCVVSDNVGNINLGSTFTSSGTANVLVLLCADGASWVEELRKVN
jgi:parallel beta helix pectate lyase-like protein